MGKTLGRLACGGSMHYDEAHKSDWGGKPVVLKIQVGDDAPIEIPITGFDFRRDQGQQMSTQITFVAREL